MKETDQKIDQHKPTFSQAEGIDPLPQPLALGELSEKARNLFWTFLHQSLSQSSSHGDDVIARARHLIDPWRRILHDHHVFFLDKPADEFSGSFDGTCSEMKSLFLHGEYNRIFDFLQFVLRHEKKPSKFFGIVEAVLKDSMCAYTVVKDGPTIVPIALPEQRESVKQSFQALASGPFEAARSHLRKSGELINANDLLGSIRESVHAVESVGRTIDPKNSKTLKPALDSLEKVGLLKHSALKEAINKLYAYASDEPGSRHSKLPHKLSTAELDEAMFVFGACTSIAAYLVNKHRQAST